MKTLNLIVKSFLFLFILVFILIPALNDNASAQDCNVTICKSAVDSGDTLFDFSVEYPEGFKGLSLLGEGEGSCDIVSIPLSQSVEVLELPIAGWQLAGVDCTDLVGVDFTLVDGGVDLDCIGPNLGSGTCTFTNVRPVSNIPTLSEWGMIAVAGGLMLVGVFFAVRRRRSAVSS